MRSNEASGFTLVELAIVIVIIGLIVGGIIAGAALIHAAELRTIIPDVEKIRTSIVLFKDKYNALPGDMSNATSLWGTDASCPNTPANTTPKAATCNGTGDTMVSGNEDSTDFYEAFRFWQQLGNAGMIGGSFTGTSAIGNSDNQTFTRGLSVMRAKYPNASFFVHTLGFSGGPGGAFPHLRQKHVIEFIADAFRGIISPTDAYMLDSKHDDGMPGTGSVVSGNWNMVLTPNCVVDPGNTPTSTYKLTDPTPACTLIFRGGF